MAYNTYLADRIAHYLQTKGITYEEKRMMGGLAFMVDDKMCIGIIGEDLMARIDPAVYEKSLEKKGCRPMDFTKRPMKGFVFIGPEGYDFDEDLESWIELALEFNPRARSSKNRSK